MPGHVLAGLLSAETRKQHRARWFVYAGAYGELSQRIPHQATMRGHWRGYDVACSCGWESRTGGATRGSVEDMLWDHRYQAQGESGTEGP
jgi:hypothetical protein